jgi:hypothetical protein
MNKISLKKILIAFLAIFLLSRSRRIAELFSELDFDGVLTLQPLRNCSEDMRYLVTLALFALAFVTIWSIFVHTRK